MRSGLLLFVAACGSNVYYYPAADIAMADLAFADEGSLDFAAADSLARDLAVDDLAAEDMSASVDMAMVPPDLLGIDFAPCGQPNGECCAAGTDCDQTAAMTSGFVGAICKSSICEPCGSTAQPCCAMNKCVRSAQLNAYCFNDPIAGKVCVECTPPSCPPQ